MPKAAVAVCWTAACLLSPDFADCPLASGSTRAMVCDFTPLFPGVEASPR